ncbi:MAG: hypothetical protein LUG99_05980 [Lachnospiraceae bacterium]|nr:hypothetical protein [Lachnospiraceae bacterium]MCD8012711.1 hypothetical protein [Lachnospiraceae bacterium]
MGTLREVKRKMKHDKDFRKALVRSAKDEIMIDVDGDGIADVALMDSTGDGDIDTLAVDLTGDGEFNLYFHDSDGNGLPDMVLLDEDGDGIIEEAYIGEEIEVRMIEAADAVLTMMAIGDYVAKRLDQELEALQNLLEEARKGLKA